MRNILVFTPGCGSPPVGSSHQIPGETLGQFCHCVILGGAAEEEEEGRTPEGGLPRLRALSTSPSEGEKRETLLLW